MTDAVARQQTIIARMERLPFHFWHVKMRLFIGVATFFDAFDAISIAYILPVIVPLWKIPPTKVGLLISMGYVGQFLGAVFFGYVAEKFGRMRSFTLSVTIFSVMSLLSMLSWNYDSLLVFRTIQGFGLGGEVPIAATYINELAKAKGRGVFFSVYELCFSIGLLFAAGLGFALVPRLGWQVMFLIGAIPAVMLPFYIKKFPESPRWLASKGRFDEAEKIVGDLEKITTDNGQKELPPLELRQVATAEMKKTNWRELFQGIYLKRTITVWLLWFCAYFVQYGSMTWIPTLFTTVYKVPLHQALQYTFTAQAFAFVASCLTAFSIDRLGRKRLFIITFSSGCITFTAMWLSGLASVQVLFVLTCVFYACMSPNALILYLYTPEVYPTRMRALGCSLGSAWLRVASALSPFIVGLIVSQYSAAMAFLMFAVVSLVGAFVAIFLVIETKNKVLEEISP